MNRTFKVISSLIIVLILTFYGFANINLGANARALFLNFPISFIPGSTNSVDLGSALKKWKNIFVGNIVGTVAITSYYSQENAVTCVAGAGSVDWDDGLCHVIYLNSGANTITMTHPEGGMRGLLIMVQPASGAAGTVTFSPEPITSADTAITLTATNNGVDCIGLYYIGELSKYIFVPSLDFK